MAAILVVNPPYQFESNYKTQRTGSDTSTAKHSAIGVSRVLGDDHCKRMPRVNVGVTR